MTVEFHIDGVGGDVALPLGYTLLAGGFRGRGWALELSDFDNSTRSGVAGDRMSREMTAALQRAGMREEQTISLEVVQEPGDAAVRGTTYGDAMVLVAPDLGADLGQVAIVVDEDGAVSFHLPVEDMTTQTVQPATTRGSGGEKVFVLRAQVPTVDPGDAGGATRALGGSVGRKLIQVVAFPLAELARNTGTSFVRGWEERNRPNRLRRFTADDYTRRPTGGWTGDDWRKLGGGAAVMLVHGTFSTAHGGFGGIPRTVVEELHRRYDGRVFAFDHHSLSMSPGDNVRWLLDQMPSGGTLDVDVVCHSRGGLVARALAGELHGLDPAPVRVRRVVFVGTPNNGTALADPEHLSVLLDRTATAANILPGIPVGEILDSVLCLVKVAAHGVLSGIEGLAAMRPDGDFLADLNRGGRVDADYFGIASDFEPSRPGLKGLLQGAQNSFVDFVFQDQGNDMVVPTRGVSAGFDNDNFPIPENQLVEFDRDRGVTHSTYWGERGTAEQLLAWLPG